MSVARLDLSTEPEPPAPIVFPTGPPVEVGPKERPPDAILDHAADDMINAWLGRGEDPEIETYRLIAVAAMRRDWESLRLLQRLTGPEWWPNDRTGRAFTSMLARCLEEVLEIENERYASSVLVKDTVVVERDEHGNPSLLRETISRELP